MTEEKQVKKVSLAEAAKQLLAQKKQAKNDKNQNKHQDTAVQKMKSQITKKANNQSRRTGV